MKDKLIQHHEEKHAHSAKQMEEWGMGDPPACMTEDERQQRVKYWVDMEEFHRSAVLWLKSV